MRDFYNKLCLLLLEESFGPIIGQIGNNLLYGPKTLSAICFGTHLSKIKVKEGLSILIKFGFVTYHKNEDNLHVEYAIHQNKIIMILRYPRYILFAKTYCGDDGEIMFEEVLKNGYITASEVIIKTYKRIEQAPSNSTDEPPSVPDLKNVFELLVKNQFLMNCTSFDTMSEDTEKPKYDLPNLDLLAISQSLEGQNVAFSDRKIYWKVNFDRFTQDLRDQTVISAVTRKFDKEAGELMREMINLMYLRTASWADTSNPIPYTEIKEQVKKLNYEVLERYIDQYLRLLEEDSTQFIKRVGDSGGGQYSVNMKNAFKELTWTTLENIVTERFGSKPARIFRLVRYEVDVSLNQIQKLAMIPAKEAIFSTYNLSQENYIQTQQLKRSGTSSVPLPYHFCIDLTNVVEMEIEHCYHALYNIITRREHESNSNKRMIEKELRVQILSANLKEHGATVQQLADIAEMMTPSETQQLEKAQNAMKKLAATEIQIDETLLILTTYFRYH
ncbi:PREDICTED: DNA-directed RNA polymerase III subunit RPC3 isoform X2 [Trachymyrmex cornetzi]|uniref:DNA-directed RNA polymerase III subunit RPC3 n=1 Tax=Trachymyrmex cornetzi TaxID=471704 RepID=A0A195E6W0_9HYME|nr:PREDICTED: DNA-directed RNA polymerase III subunit RPC3 isoform X2 [Trachymyrmex cornetzi]KYN20584.1 DNA-directed RNA polymerase III subunit RPC3 [Trachymyrmex cornetzi]